MYYLQIMDSPQNLYSLLLQDNFHLFDRKLRHVAERISTNFNSVSLGVRHSFHKEYDNYFSLDGCDFDDHIALISTIKNSPDKIVNSKINVTGKTIFFNHGEGTADADTFNSLHSLIRLSNIQGECYYANLAENLEELYMEFCHKHNEPMLLKCFTFESNPFAKRYHKSGINGKYSVYQYFDVPGSNIIEEKKLYCCFNLKPRMHRAGIISLLHYKNLLDQGYVSSPHEFYEEREAYIKEKDWVQFVNHSEKQLSSLAEFNSIKECLTGLKELYPLRVDSRTRFADTDEVLSSTHLYKCRIESLFELITETIFTGSHFFTEKTYYPIFLGKPFLMVGSYGMLSSLRKQGYKTFEPYIDESYDLEKDDAVRLLKIVNEVERLAKLRKENPQEFYQNYNFILEIANFNKNLFLDRG